MGYQYDAEQMRSLLDNIIRQAVAGSEYGWLQQQLSRFMKEKQHLFFNITFTTIPRFIKKVHIHLGEKESEALQKVRRGFCVNGWTADRAARCWWLLHLPADPEDRYMQRIESLFKSAEMNEQVALYGALPLFAYPEQFRLRTSEGLRTSIGAVFEAIALDNPYPSEYLEEPAWNQLVLKAFFMEEPVNRIIGLEKRANKNLARILSDYAHERWAAGRKVSPLLWRPAGKFLDEKIWPDIQKLFQSGDEKERKAAALACYDSRFGPALEILDQYPDLKSQIEKEILTWETLV